MRIVGRVLRMNPSNFPRAPQVKVATALASKKKKEEDSRRNRFSLQEKSPTDDAGDVWLQKANLIW